MSTTDGLIVIGAGGYLLVVGGDPATFRSAHGIPPEVAVLGPRKLGMLVLALLAARRRRDNLDLQIAAIEFHGIFSAGYMRFHGRKSSDSCCGFMRVYVDGKIVTGYGCNT